MVLYRRDDRSGGGFGHRLRLGGRGVADLPAERRRRADAAGVALTLGGGGTSKLKLPVDIWFRGDTYVARVPGDVTGVRIDPDTLLPDVDRSNNTWPRSQPLGAR